MIDRSVGHVHVGLLDNGNDNGNEIIVTLIELFL